MSQTIQIQADWAQTDSTQIDFIKNKPNLYEEWWGTQSEYDAILVKDPDKIYNIKTVYYAVSISAGSNGSVTVNGVTGNYTATVPSGTTLTIEGTADSNYQFDEWSDGNTDNPRIITVNGDITLSAAFEEVVVLPDYFYVEDESGSDNTLSIVKNNASAPDITVYKSTDRVNWVSMGTTDTTAITATVPANGKLYLKATTNRWCTNKWKHDIITCTDNYNVGGNIMSLLYGDNFENNNVLPTGVTYVFADLFYNDTMITNSNKLVLPATTLTDYCYAYMFSGCTNLVTSPTSLPATTLAIACYEYMFRNCSNLTTTPEIFASDNNVTQCMDYMFNGCSKVNRIVTHFSNFNNTTTYLWVQNVAATGDFYNYNNASITFGVSGIPNGWTEHLEQALNDSFYLEDVSGSSNTFTFIKSVDRAPYVNIITSTDRVNWTSIGTTNITGVTATVPANGKLYIKSYINGWASSDSLYNTITTSGNVNVGGKIAHLLYGNSDNGNVLNSNTYSHFRRIFFQNSKLISTQNLILTSNANMYSYAEMFYNCTSLTTAPATLPSTFDSNGYNFYYMFKGCTGLTTLPTDLLPATALASFCYYSMFQDCTNITNSPVLPATTLTQSCYSYMFKGCTSLTTVTTYAQDISATNCLTDWLNNVSATGEFFNLGSATYPSGGSGIPTGWTEHTSL